MAFSQKERRANRRKMVIQAGINAKRNSLMNLSAARYNAMAQRPQTIQSRPVRSAGNVISDPERLPGRDIVDANNSAAINLARQNPGVNLTDELNRRAAAQTNADLMKMSYGGMPESKGAVIQDQYYTNAEDAQVAAPEILTPLPAIQPTPLDYGPGLTPVAAEERYGPGGMYGTTPLPGGAYEQMGISPAIFPSSGSPTTPGSATSTAATSMAAPRSATEHLTDAVKKIKKRAAIIRGTAALVGGDASVADRYEAEALASLGVYAGQYAMSQLTDKDFKDKQTLMQSLIEKNMPLDQILKVLDSGVVESAKEKKFVNWTDGTKTISLREGQQAPPGYWVGKLEGGSKGNSMRFIDEEGVGHLGYVQHDENGIPRNFLMDGTPVPLDWDMVSPIAPRNKTEITNNLGKQGEKMGEARQIAMAKMSRKWANDAASYFFDESGKFTADRWDVIKSAINLPGEGRLAWTAMKNALAAALRLESGAAIGVEEAANYKSRFFPEVTDTPKTIIWKLRAFSDYVRALEEVNNPQWVYENLPHPAWNPKKVRTQKERDALPHGSYFLPPNGQLSRYVPNQKEPEVLLQ